MDSLLTKKDTWIGFSGQIEDLYFPPGTDFRKMQISHEKHERIVSTDDHKELNKTFSFNQVV